MYYLHRKEWIPMKVGFWKRVAALTLDEVVLVSLTFVCLYLFRHQAIFHRWTMRVLFYELLDYNYYTLCWKFGGQTVGKRLMRARVVRMDGKELTYWDTVVRYWVWMFGICFVGIGYFWMAWDRDKRGWNDHAARTKVILVTNVL